MTECVSISFTENGKEYFAIIRRKIRTDKTRYEIVVMNRELNNLLVRHGFDEISDPEVLTRHVSRPEQRRAMSICRNILNGIRSVKKNQKSWKYEFIRTFDMITKN